MADNITVEMFDKVQPSWQRATWGTPFHVACCCETTGEVVAMASSSACNNSLCGCLGCRSYMGGIHDAQGLSAAVELAKKAYHAKKRMPAGSFATRAPDGTLRMPAAPKQVQMM